MKKNKKPDPENDTNKWTDHSPILKSRTGGKTEIVLPLAKLRKT
jgi:hypothetical protein